MSSKAQLQDTKAFSPASIGKAILRAFGITPILERQPSFPKDVLGYGMAAYFGGRVECRIRRAVVPVVYVDFLSMYPTVCTLMGLWRFLTCRRVDVEDATEEVRAVLNGNVARDCFDPHLWPQLCVLVQIAPDGDLLPTRAKYQRGGTWQIGLNPLHSQTPLWFTLPDAIASAILTARPSKVLRALRLVPRGTTRSLKPVMLRGEVNVDPVADDFFKVAIEQRARLADRASMLPKFLKVLVNATAYGINAEVNRRELSSDETEQVTVFGFDAPFETRTGAPEDPGEFFFAPMAALVTGAARLMLALLEAAVTSPGGTYAFCDTDSMAIVATSEGGPVPCPGGAVPMADGSAGVLALSYEQVDRIRAAFLALNPYDPGAVPESILKLENENIDRQGQRRQLWCFAISSKRNALFERPSEREINVLRPLEHGLGHLLNPTDPRSDDRAWIPALWELLIRQALELEAPEPPWLYRPALSRTTVSKPWVRRAFRHYNKDRPFDEQVKPFNFVVSAQIAPFGHPEGYAPERFHLVAPFELDPDRWESLPWFDLYSGDRIRITTREEPGVGVARVKTYGDVLTEYRVHPESKSLGLDGRPCARDTVGLLGRRPVIADRIALIGKESNRLEDVVAGLVHSESEVLSTYVQRFCECGCGQLVSGRARYASVACRMRAYRGRLSRESTPAAAQRGGRTNYKRGR